MRLKLQSPVPKSRDHGCVPNFRRLRPHHSAPTVRRARPGHRPAGRVVQSAACSPSHDQRGGAQAGRARRRSGGSSCRAIRSSSGPMRRRSLKGWCCAGVRKKSHIIVTDFEADLPTPYTARRSRSSRCAVRSSASSGYGGGQPRHVRSLAALARDLRDGARCRGGPAGLAAEGAGIQGGPHFAAPESQTRRPRGLALQDDPAWTFLTGPLSPDVVDRAAEQGAAARQR